MASAPPTRVPGSVQFLLVVGGFAWGGLIWGGLELIAPGWPYHWFRLWAPLAALPYWLCASLYIDRRYGEGAWTKMNRDQSEGLRTGASRELDGGNGGGARTQMTWEQTWGFWFSRISRWVFAYFFGALMLGIALVRGFGEALPEWQVAHGGGIAGSFELASSNCGNGCPWWGYFNPDSGNWQAYVELSDPLPASVTSVSADYGRPTLIAARYSDVTGHAYAYSGSTAWHDPAINVAACGLFVIADVGWLWWYFRRRRRARLSQPNG